MDRLRRLGVDALGVLLILAAIAFGWLPGIGGIPLFLAGLGLLATNHAWARRLLDHVKTHGLRLANAFFREHRALMLVYDVLSILFLAGATAILIEASGNLLRSLSFVLVFLGTGLFFGNRKRLQRLQRKYGRVKNKR